MRQKLLHAIYEPVVLILLWLSFLLSPLLSVFRLYFVVKSDILNIHIVGLSTLFLYFPFFISSAVLIILIFWFRRFIDKKISETHKKTLRFLSISSVVFLVIARGLLVLEQKNYPNFLYEHFGLTVPQMELMSFVAALELIVFLFMLLYNRSFKLTKQNRQGRATGPAIGNQPVLRYFLFPRTLISGALLDNQEFAQQIGIAYFVEIDPLSHLTHWPKIDERNKTIIFDERTEIKYKTIETVFKSDEG